MLIALIALSGLLAVAGMAVLSVQRRMSVGAHARFTAVALYAAESGLAAGLEFLRINIDPEDNWSEWVSQNNATPQRPSAIIGNEASAGDATNPLSAGSRARYEVEVLNNPNDPGFATGTDEDGQVILRVRGLGPDGALVMLELEVAANGLVQARRPCPGYAQRGIAEDGAGRNDCLDRIEGADTATYRPGA